VDFDFWESWVMKGDFDFREKMWVWDGHLVFDFFHSFMIFSENTPTWTEIL
jgi:hypothetical protein